MGYPPRVLLLGVDQLASDQQPPEQQLIGVDELVSSLNECCVCAIYGDEQALKAIAAAAPKLLNTVQSITQERLQQLKSIDTVISF